MLHSFYGAVCIDIIVIFLQLGPISQKYYFLKIFMNTSHQCLLVVMICFSIHILCSFGGTDPIAF